MVLYIKADIGLIQLEKIIINDEPPVNLFKPTAKQSNQKVFNDVFNEMNKKENYEDGDGIFLIITKVI